MFTSIESVLLFPGQGGYDERFLSELALRHPEVGLAFSEIDDVSARFGGRSISDQLLRGRTPSLDVLLSENPDLLQLAIYGTSVSAFRVASAEGIRGDVFVGHSFGEVAALVAAGAYSIGEGAEIVFRRNAVLRDTAIESGAMLAVAADRQRIERLLDVIGDPYTVIAVENGPTQTVVTGPKAAITAIGTITAALGVSTKLLASPYPFHSPMLAKGVGELSRQLQHLPGGPLLTPVYSPMLGRHLRPTDHLGEYLAGGLVNPVWFGTALRKLHDDGARSFLECGAGRALSGIVARNLPGVKATSLVPGEHLAAPAADAVPQPAQVARRSRAEVFSEVASMYCFMESIPRSASRVNPGMALVRADR